MKVVVPVYVSVSYILIEPLPGDAATFAILIDRSFAPIPDGCFGRMVRHATQPYFLKEQDPGPHEWIAVPEGWRIGDRFGEPTLWSTSSPHRWLCALAATDLARAGLEGFERAADPVTSRVRMTAAMAG